MSQDSNDFVDSDLKYFPGYNREILKFTLTSQSPTARTISGFTFESPVESILKTGSTEIGRAEPAEDGSVTITPTADLNLTLPENGEIEFVLEAVLAEDSALESVQAVLTGITLEEGDTIYDGAGQDAAVFTSILGPEFTRVDKPYLESVAVASSAIGLGTNREVFKFNIVNPKDTAFGVTRLSFTTKNALEEDVNIYISTDTTQSATIPAGGTIAGIDTGFTVGCRRIANALEISIFANFPDEDLGDGPFQLNLQGITSEADGFYMAGDSTQMLGVATPLEGQELSFDYVDTATITAHAYDSSDFTDDQKFYLPGYSREVMKFKVKNESSTADTITGFTFTSPVKLEVKQGSTTVGSADSSSDSVSITGTSVSLGTGAEIEFTVEAVVPANYTGSIQASLTGITLNSGSTVYDGTGKDADPISITGSEFALASNPYLEAEDTNTNEITLGTERTVFKFKVNNPGSTSVDLSNLSFSTAETLEAETEIPIKIYDSADTSTVIGQGTLNSGGASISTSIGLDADTSKTLLAIVDFPTEYSASTFTLQLEGITADAANTVFYLAEKTPDLVALGGDDEIAGNTFDIIEARYEQDELIMVHSEDTTDEEINTAKSTLVTEGLEILREEEGFTVFGTSTESDLDSLITTLNTYSLQKNYIYKTTASDSPNDPGLLDGSQWAVDNIDLTEAWALQNNASGIKVAILDTGVDADHKDLAGNIELTKDIVAGTGDNELTEDIDPNGHGTHVAGIIGAVGDNNEGITGTAQEVQLFVANIFSETEDGDLGASTTDLIAGIEWAAENGAQIINLSLGGGDRDDLLQSTIESYEDDILFVIAAGNDSEDNDTTPTYPASYDSDNILSVAATNEENTLTTFSNYGDVSVDVAAPGDLIYSTLPGDQYGRLSGTSMAAPLVTGIAALMLAEDPGLTVDTLKSLLIAAADTTFPTETTSGGRINANTALQSVQSQNEVIIAEATDSPEDGTDIVSDGTNQTAFKFTATNNSGDDQTLTGITFKITKDGENVTGFPTVDFQNGTTIVDTDNTAGTTFDTEYTYSVDDDLSATEGSNVNTYSVLLNFERGDAGKVQFHLVGVTLADPDTEVSGDTIEGETLNLISEVMVERVDTTADGVDIISGETAQNVLYFSVKNQSTASITATGFTFEVFGDSTEPVDLKVFSDETEIGNSSFTPSSDGTAQSITLSPSQSMDSGANPSFSVIADFPENFTDEGGDTFQVKLTGMTFSTSGLGITREDNSDLSDNPVSSASFDILPKDFEVLDFTPTEFDTTVTTSPTVEGQIEGNFDLTGMTAVITVSGDYNNGSLTTISTSTKYDVSINSDRTFSQNLVSLVQDENASFEAFESGKTLEITVGLSRNGTSEEMSETTGPHEITPTSDFPMTLKF